MTSNDIFLNIKNKKNICLIGGLGDIQLFVDLLDKLEIEHSIIPKKYVLITSPETFAAFQNANLDLDKVHSEVHEYDYQTILRENYPKVSEICESLINEQEKDFEIICEITGGTKPVSIALMSLAEQKGLLRIYFSGRKFVLI